MRFCLHPGCKKRQEAVRCDEHSRGREQVGRGSSTERGYDWRWRKAAKAFLALPENALCRVCRVAGVRVAATVVDHVVPHRGDERLFWDVTNWQPVCAPCHNRKTGGGE
jgi:5-methylcytosine-specific restriction protein A